MTGEGMVLRDLIDVSEGSSPDTQNPQPGTIQQLQSSPLPVTDGDGEKGPAQVQHRIEVDLGWDTEPKDIPDPLIYGLDNEDLWVLVRRFNKQIFHIKQSSKQPIGGLDLNVSGEEEFSPNKLRSQFERLYMGLIIGFLSFCKHVARVRSWNETRRTAAFCAIYFAAWAANHLASVLLMLFVAVSVSTRARRFFFPPAPLALVDYKTGGVSRPAAGTLGSTGTATGAPENLRGEALENEASNFVTGVGAIALNTMTGGDPHGEAETEGDGILDALPQPDAAATMVATAKDKAEGVALPSGDKSKAPMEQKMWAQMKPLMHLLSVVSDTWERCAHLLSPVPPFSRDSNRRRVIGLLTPPLAASFLLTPNTIFRLVSLIVGVGFFGDPLITKALAWLDHNVVGWRTRWHINNTLFKGVPTDAQLALVLLRLGESNKAPLPPPPIIRDTPPENPLELRQSVLDASGGDKPLGATPSEIHEASKHREDEVDEAGGNDSEMTSTTTDSKKRSKFLGFIKGGFKGAVKVGTTVDKVRAKAGTESAKQRVGVIPKKGHHDSVGRIRFEGRYHGQPGYLALKAEGNSHSVSFHEDKKAPKEGSGPEEPESSEGIWRLSVNEITALEKHSGYGFKSKLLAGWAMDREIRDSLEIVDNMGKSFVITAMPFRDELFNRLCAIGAQTWEIW